MTKLLQSLNECGPDVMRPRVRDAVESVSEKTKGLNRSAPGKVLVGMGSESETSYICMLWLAGAFQFYFSHIHVQDICSINMPCMHGLLFSRVLCVFLHAMRL